MDFLHKKPMDVGGTLPVNLVFEVDEVDADYKFTLWDYAKECQLGCLNVRKKEGCYITATLGEENAKLGAGHYQIRVMKNCVECACIPIKMSSECVVNLVRIDEPKMECKFCE